VEKLGHRSRVCVWLDLADGYRREQREDLGRYMKAVAIKKSSREKTVGFQEMGTLRCDRCGEEFFLGHDPASGDISVAETQAKWLEKVLAEEHERDKKHPDRIELPE
jgi:hypothetical protein